MAKTLRVGLIGYGFMGKAHSNAWRQAPHFFSLKSKVEMHTICGRDRARVETARAQLGCHLTAQLRAAERRAARPAQAHQSK